MTFQIPPAFNKFLRAQSVQEYDAALHLLLTSDAIAVLVRDHGTYKRETVQLIASAADKIDDIIFHANYFAGAVVDKLQAFVRDYSADHYPNITPQLQVQLANLHAKNDLANLRQTLDLLWYLIPKVSQAQLKQHPAFLEGNGSIVINVDRQSWVIHGQFAQVVKDLQFFRSVIDAIPKLLQQLATIGQQHDRLPPELLLTLIMMRHGPKASGVGEASAKSSEFSQAIARNVARFPFLSNLTQPHSDAQIHITTSPVQRARDSAPVTHQTLGQAGLDAKEKAPVSSLLGTPFLPPQEAPDDLYAQDYKLLRELQTQFRAKELQEGFVASHSGLSEVALEEELRAIVDQKVLMVLYGERRLAAPRFKTSFASLAAPLAKRVQGFLKHSLDLKMLRDKRGFTKPEYIQIDITHSFGMTAFLKQYLVFENGTHAREMDIASFFGATGGVVREGGFFQMQFIAKGSAVTIQVTAEFTPGKSFRGTIEFN